MSASKKTGSVWLLPSQGDGQVEDREHHGAAVISEQVSYDGRGDGGVTGLSDTHQSPGEYKQPVVLQREKKKKKEIGVLLSSSVSEDNLKPTAIFLGQKYFSSPTFH